MPSPCWAPQGLGVTGGGGDEGSPFCWAPTSWRLFFLSINIAEIIKPALTCVCLHGEFSVGNGSLSFAALLSLKLPVLRGL